MEVIFAPFRRQISSISVDGENPKGRSVRRHGCSQRKHSDQQEKKVPHEMQKLIQAETAETGRVSAASVVTDVQMDLLLRPAAFQFKSNTPRD